MRRSVTFTLREERGVEKHEQIGGFVAPVFAVVALDPPGFGRDRQARLSYKLNRALVEADYRSLGVRRLGVRIEHVLDAGDVVGVDLGTQSYFQQRSRVTATASSADLPGR